MKKILAIAVATAISAPAMADMTISGTVAVGYTTTDKTGLTVTEASDSATAAVAAGTNQTYGVTANEGNGGFGVDTATIIISGSETLENGITVAATMGVGGLARGETLGGKDAGLTFSGDFGSIAIKAAEIGHGVFGYGSSVAENFQGELSAAASNADSISYTAPAMGMVTLSASYTEAVGLGKGEDTNFDPSIKAAIAVNDALSGFVQYTNYDSESTADSRLRVGAKYDAGSVIVSAATGTTDNSGTTKDLTNTVVGVTLPMGATTLGANYGTKDQGTADTDLSAWSVGMKHELSSNLAVSAKYTNYETSATADVTNTSVLVSLSF